MVKIAVAGDMDQTDLLRAERRVRDDLVEMPGISRSDIQEVSPFEISIEADPVRLRDHGLTFADLSAAIQRSSLDLPAGQIQTDEGTLMIRSKGQAYDREDFENIVIRPEGEALGLTQLELLRQVRAAFFGEQAQRVQRERDDIRVMDRLPLQQRQSLSTLDQLRIRAPSGGEAPFHSVFTRARWHINRIDGAQAIPNSAKSEDENVDVVDIPRNLATARPHAQPASGHFMAPHRIRGGT